MTDCVIYKGKRKSDTYLFVERENDFSRVPAALLALLGDLEIVMALQLTPERQLAQTTGQVVIENLREQGYYLQLPPDDPELHPPRLSS